MFARGSSHCYRRPMIPVRCCLQRRAHRGPGRIRVQLTATVSPTVGPFRDLLRPSHGARIASLSTTASSSAAGPDDEDAKKKKLDNRSRLGIGGSKLSSPDQLDQYASVIATALTHGVTTFESSAVEPGGEDALAHAYAAARNQVEREGDVKSPGRTTVLARFGYRTTTTTGGAASSPASNGGDGDASSSIDDVSFEGDVPVGSGPATASEGCHCIHPSYVEHRLTNSPLVKMRREDYGKDEMDLIYAVHNPEAQGAASFGPTLTDDDGGSSGSVSSPPLDEVRELVRERMTDSFVALEEACSNDTIDGYGVCSNGLSLPVEHPLHLSWMDVLWAASDAAQKVHGKPTPPKLATLQLPANLLETNGIAVATEIRDFLQKQHRLKQQRGEEEVSSGGERGNDNGVSDASELLMVPSNSVDLCISRPLTCYSDRGTGTGHPFKLVDYRIDTGLLSDDDVDGSSNGKQWTHLMGDGRPPSYVQALNAAMGHFDAESILEEQKSRKLTVEERETLDGCRLLQSMLHDLDRNLQTVRSFSAYEEDLYQKVVPLIHDTFEGLDEDSTNVLQNFFMAHGSAVRHAIARTTRELLLEGGDGVSPYDIPADVTLQQFALQWLLGHDPSVVSKVIVGCPQPAHVLEAIQAADRLDR